MAKDTDIRDAEVGLNHSIPQVVLREGRGAALWCRRPEEEADHEVQSRMLAVGLEGSGGMGHSDPSCSQDHERFLPSFIHWPTEQASGGITCARTCAEHCGYHVTKRTQGSDPQDEEAALCCLRLLHQLAL